MRAARGFILIATLGAIAVLALLIGFFAARVDLLRENTVRLKASFDGQRAIDSALSEVLMRFMTLPPGPLGIGEDPATRIALDGRLYRIGNAIVSIQDSRGLLSLNSPDVPMLRRFLATRGVAPERINVLIDTLADYTDADNLRRLNGAEETEYRERGLPPPPNDWIGSVRELNQIIGWREWLQAQPDLDPASVFTATRDGAFNPNSAPREVLLALPGATAEGVDRLLAWRATGAITSEQHMFALSGIVLDPEATVFFPSPMLHVRIWPQAEGLGAEYNLLLTPGSNRKPWQIFESRSLARPAKLDDAIPALPPLAP